MQDRELLEYIERLIEVEANSMRSAGRTFTRLKGVPKDVRSYYQQFYTRRRKAVMARRLLRYWRRHSLTHQLELFR